MDAELKKAQRELTDRVMGRSGVEGTAIGERKGKPCLVVYVSGKEGRKHVPASIRGFRVVTEKTGGFKAL